MKNKSFRVLAYSFLILMVVISVTPVYILLINATRSSTEISQGFSFIPGTSLLDNIQGMLNNSYVDIIRSLMNSIIVSVPSTILLMYFSGLTAYGFAMYEFKGKKKLYNLVLMSLMIPAQLTLIGFYQVCSWLGLLDSFLPLIITGVAGVSSVYFVHSYLKQLNLSSIVESGRLDGMSELRIYNTLIMPIIKPSLFTMGIMNFIATWNNYLIPLTILQSPDKFTLPVSIAQLKSFQYDIDFGVQYVAILVSLIPILIVFLIFSKHIISGISSGAVKE